MMLKVLVTRQVFPEVLDFLRVHFDVEDNQADVPLDRDALIERLRDKDGAVVLPTEGIDEGVLDCTPKLKAVCCCSVGYNNIDLAACSTRGVLVTNTPGVLTDTTADHAFALVLATARRLTAADRWVREGKWQRWTFGGWLGADVYGATLGIIGMGRIGQAVAKRSRGFAMRVLYHNRSRLREAEEHACNAVWVTREALLRQSDFVVLTLPYSGESHHLIGAAELALMKPTAHLVNVARGGIVDDAALAAALNRGTIAGAALDVFENEPALDDGLLGLSNVVLSPHIGSASRATRMKMGMLAAENLVAALTTGTPPNLLNPQAGEKRP